MFTIRFKFNYELSPVWSIFGCSHNQPLLETVHTQTNMKVSCLFIILCSVVCAPEGMESSFRITLISLLFEMIVKFKNFCTNLFLKQVFSQRWWSFLKPWQSHGVEAGQNRGIGPAAASTEKGPDHNPDHEKLRSSILPESHLVARMFWKQNTGLLSIFLNQKPFLTSHFFLFRKGRSRSSSSSNSDSDGASRRHRHSRSSKLSEVERLAEMERQRAAQNARLM